MLSVNKKKIKKIEELKKIVKNLQENKIDDMNLIEIFNNRDVLALK